MNMNIQIVFSSIGFFRKHSVFILSISIFSIFISSCTGPRTEEDLAEAVIEAFVNDDQRAFKHLYVKQLDIETLINDSSIPDDMKKNAKRDLRAKTAFFKIISK